MLHGEFVVAADGSVSSYSGSGVSSVVEASTGKYTITLADPWMKVRRFLLNAVNTGAINHGWQFISATYESDARSSTPVVKLGHVVTSSGGFAAPVAGTYLFTVFFEDSNQS